MMPLMIRLFAFATIIFSASRCAADAATPAAFRQCRPPMMRVADAARRQRAEASRRRARHAPRQRAALRYWRAAAARPRARCLLSAHARVFASRSPRWRCARRADAAPLRDVVSGALFAMIAPFLRRDAEMIAAFRRRQRRSDGAAAAATFSKAQR